MPSGISVDFNRDAEHDIVVLPSNLYAYTDSSITGTQMYAWTCEENVYGGYYDNNATYTIYTTTENPTSSSTFYDKDGNEFTSSSGTVVYDNEGLGNHYVINSAQTGTTNGTPNINFYTYIASSGGGSTPGGNTGDR